MEPTYRRHPTRTGLLLSSDGRVYREIRQSRHSAGYMVIGIRLAPGRKSKTEVLYVHQLLLEAFVGSCPGGMECRHLDGDPTNNQQVNLCWGTRLENAEDARRHGTMLIGSKANGAKLNEADIPEIRRLAAEGLSQPTIAERFGVSRTAIESILIGRSWRHVP